MIVIIQDFEFRLQNHNVHSTRVQGCVKQTLSVEALEVRHSNEETQKKIYRNKRITTQRKEIQMQEKYFNTT